ncbi:MAG: translocation/assembly module TamB domain-containing protein [Acidobacteriales bacterium]|nr:translocation/assembly module TamB domain-containing protein [Terriglobales bacterium]
MTKRRAKIALLIAAGLCLSLVATCLVVVRTSWFREKVRERIVREVERATGGRAEIGSFQFDGGQLRAEIRDFVLHGTEREGAPLVRARRVAVVLKLVSALRRDIDIQSLEVETPQVRISVHPDGSTNLPHPKVPRGTRNAVEQFLALAIGRVDIVDGTAECGIEQIGINLHGGELRARLFYKPAPEMYLGQVSLSQAKLDSARIPAGPMDIAASIELEGNRIAFREARIRTAKSSAILDGEIADWRSPRLAARFSGEFSIAEFARSWSLPVAPTGMASFQGGLRYDTTGGWRAQSNIAAKGLAYQGYGVRIEGASLNGAADWSPGRLNVRRMNVAALGGRFDGDASLDGNTDLRVDGRVTGLPIDRVFAARGLATPPWNGAISGEVHLRGKASSPAQRLAATLALAGPSIGGNIQLGYDGQIRRLSLGKTVLETAASRVEMEGDPGRSLRVALETRNFQDLAPAFTLAGTVPPQPFPVALEGGSARFEGAITGGLSSPRIQGHVVLHNAIYEGLKYDRASASIDVASNNAQIENLSVERGKMRLAGEAQFGLSGFRVDGRAPLTASLSVVNADLSALVRSDPRLPPLSGTASAHLKLQGTFDQPAVRGSVELAKGSVASQPFDAIRGTVDYAGSRLAISKAQATIGGAPVEWSAVYTHTPGNWQRGSLSASLAAAEVPLSRIEAWKSMVSAADGRVNVQLEGAADIDEKGIRIRQLTALAESLNVTLGNRPLGSVRMRAVTSGDTMEIHPRAELAGAVVSGVVRVGLDATHPVAGDLQFRRLALSTLRACLAPNNPEPLPVEAFSEGKLTIRGQGLEPLRWQVRADIELLEIKPRTGAIGSKLEELGLRNAEPIVIEGTLGEWRVSRARLLGHDTNLEIGGKVSLGAKGRFDLRFRGGVNLAILRDFEKDLSASGRSELDAEVRGPLDDPGLYGRLKLVNASLYFSGVPNGLDRANGTVFFDRNRATIESLTAQTGGGTLALNGFLGFGGADTVYRLQATANQVRVRYPEGVSTTANATLNLTGTAGRSLLSGTVRIARSSISTHVDMGSLLAQSSQAVVTPVISNELLRGMQFDVRIETVPNARLETTLTRDIQIEANLRLRGSPSKPILLGRISATQGELNFFGTKYNIARGEVSFVNPVKLEPVVNLDLETRIRGIDITVNLAGPPNKLNMTYRSDPPLQLQELMALLTVGRAPSTNPSVAVRQFDTGLDWQQVGAGALLGQALATPVTGRLQRFFGVSRIKIDPQLRGIENNPQARLTVEQQISKDVTFTYITNLNKGQQQIVGLQWNVNKQWSIQAVREENGIFDVEFLYRKSFK